MCTVLYTNSLQKARLQRKASTWHSWHMQLNDSNTWSTQSSNIWTDQMNDFTTHKIIEFNPAVRQSYTRLKWKFYYYSIKGSNIFPLPHLQHVLDKHNSSCIHVRLITFDIVNYWPVLRLCQIFLKYPNKKQKLTEDQMQNKCSQKTM